MSNTNSLTSCQTAGHKFKAMITNSRIACMGSGIALIGPDMKIGYSVLKSARGTANLALMSLLNPEIKDTDKMLRELQQAARGLKDQAFAPGETILEYCGQTLVSNNNHSVVLVNSVRLTPQGERIEIVIKVNLVDAQPAMKVRGPGIKATTLPYQVQIEYLNADGSVRHTRMLGEEILFPNEARKGAFAQFTMFAEAHAHLKPRFELDGTLSLLDLAASQANPNQTITTQINVAPAGYPEEFVTQVTPVEHRQTINLLAPDNTVRQWIKDNTQTARLMFDINKNFYDNNLDLFQGDDVEVLVIDDRTVRVYETIELLEGDLVLSIEVSTPKENIGCSSLILEQMLVASTTYPAFTKMWEMGAPRREAILNFTKYASGQFNHNAVEARLIDLAGIATSNLAIDLKMLTGKALVKALLDLVIGAGGEGNLALVSNSEFGVETKTVINLPALLKLGVYAHASGAATGIAESFELLIRYALKEDKAVPGYTNRLHGLNKLLGLKLKQWMSEVTDAKGAMKALGITQYATTSGKVKTSLSPSLCRDADNLPIVIMSPNCPMIQRLDVQEGDVLALTRSPMPFPIMAKVKILDEGLVGHFMVCPESWARGNGGDSKPLESINLSQVDES